MKRMVTYAIVGYGGRGSTFAAELKNPELFGKVVAVAEPDPDRRAQAAKDIGLPPDRVFASDRELLAQPRLADGLIVTTLDRLHAQAAVPAMEKGYHLLLEKPMAVTLPDCQAIEATQRKTGVVVTVCHSLRYNPQVRTLKKLIDSGAIGEPISFDHLEAVEPIHFSHSFCRGNWGNTSRSTFMLMSKSCHDLDEFQFLFERRCKQVASFGSLTHFTRKNAPAGAPERCLDGCPAELECPYHCGKIYYIRDAFWTFVFPRRDEASVLEYLKTGPYGKCVYQTDNDVVDHQVVNLEYEGGLTGVFTMTAFSRMGRCTRVHGTKGELRVDPDGRLRLLDFASHRTDTIETPVHGGTHAGGDYLVLKNLTDCIRDNNPSGTLTTAQASLESHTVVFAAEKARLENRVVSIEEFRS